jgi:hypothetical protein
MSAKGQMQTHAVQKKRDRYSITSLARASSEGATSYLPSHGVTPALVVQRVISHGPCMGTHMSPLQIEERQIIDFLTKSYGRALTEAQQRLSIKQAKVLGILPLNETDEPWHADPMAPAWPRR